MKINLTAPINSLGYGVAAYNILCGLYDRGEELALWPIGHPEEMPRMDVLQAVIQNSRQMPPNGAPSVKIWHQHELQQHIGKGLHVGFPIFELNTFTEIEKNSLKYCDALFVCSKWAKEILEENGLKIPTHVVPLGVDSDIFHPCEISRENTIFFNCGKWEKRKGHDVVLECFNKAFSSTDNVELWMMCDNPFPQGKGEEWEKKYKTCKLADKVTLISRQKTQKNVYNIMRQTDCGIFPARAEGWNLELLEMMACAKHVIATNYSGHTEFCNDKNCYLVDVKNLETAYDDAWFFGQGLWAEVADPQKNQIIDYMQSIHKKKQSGSLKKNMAGVDTAMQFSWTNSAKTFLKGLSSHE